jgi:dTDP-4-amino-4,6-dideoxygalactose transaminase/glycosyltransferase involved in cell wall biosynthesis
MDKLFCGPPSFGLGELLHEYLRQDVAWWFGDRQVYYVHKARTAIRRACQLLNLTAQDEVLAPAYNCGAEIDALLSSGVLVTLYEVERSSYIDIADLSRRVTNKTKVIYVTHYFGFPQPVSKIKKLCVEKGIFLIEDCALSLFSCDGPTKLGSVGDIAVFNFPKVLPVPDGGALVINNPDLAKDVWLLRNPPIPGTFSEVLPLFKSYILRQSENTILYPLLWSVLKRTRRFSRNGSDQALAGLCEIPKTYYFDEHLSDRAASEITKRILRTCHVNAIVEQRRKNFALYSSLLSDAEGVEPLFRTLPEGVCPLCFPVIVKNRKQICDWMRDLSIDVVEWWSGYHRGFSWQQYPNARFLKDNLLALPVHQQLKHSHVELIGKKLKHTVNQLSSRDKSVISTDDKIGSNPPPLDVVCFGGGDWWYHNRGHIDMQLMRRFARLGKVLYVNSIVVQKPSLKRGTGGGRSLTEKLVRKTRSMLRGLRRSDAGFWVYSPFSLPVHHIAWLRVVNEKFIQCQLRIALRKLGIRNPVVWVACPAGCDVAIKMKKSKLVYQRTDRFEEYPNVDTDTIKQYDRKLKAHADVTIFVNNKLYTEEANQCKRAFYLDHGVDFELFAMAQNSGEIPSDIKDTSRPIIGFFGGIDSHTSDIDLLEKVTDLLPEMNFVFVGSPSVDCQELLSNKNVRMLGQKPYEEIPRYGKCFDVAIMPWRQNRWIEACNPIKLKEYLALGKPVVSTPFPELQKYLDVIYQAKTPVEFAERIRQALAEDCPQRIDARREKVRHATWDSKAELVLQILFEQEKHVTGRN